MTNNLDLPKPHGFLIWRGKQTSIASTEPLETEKELLLTSNGEAFGYLTLSQPSQMVIREFDRVADKHCIRPEERKMLWPDIETFYVYPIASFEGFSKTKRFNNGKIIERKLTDSEMEVIEQAEKLPKQILIANEAVILDNTGHKCISQCEGVEELHKSIEVILNDIDIGDNELPLYDLALVRKPLLSLKKKEEIKQEGDTMPWDIREDFDDCSGFAVVKEDNDEIEGCHETREEAEAQLAALNIAEDDKQSDLLVARLDEIRGAFNAHFNHNEMMWDSWLIDASDTYVIAEMESIKYRIPFMRMDNEIIFSSREDWREVELVYSDKSIGASLLSRLSEMTKAIKQFITPKKPEAKMFATDAGFEIKEINGEPWLFTWSANAFKDREKEIFSTKSLENWVKKVEDREVKGYFNFYHIPGTDFAQKQWVAVPGRILVEAGPFLDNELGQAALKTLKQYPQGHPDVSPEGWGCSVEYKYLPEERVTGVYDNINISRTSVLPLFAAANIWTQVSEVKEMAMTDEQKQATIAMFGDELAGRLIGDAENKSTELESNVDHKNKKDAEATEEETTEEETEEAAEEDAEEISLENVADAVAKQLSKQFSIDLEPVVEAIGVVVENQKKFEERLNKFEKTDNAARKHNMTKQMFNLVRATKTEDTKLADGDNLKDKKPKESTRAQQDGSFAGAYFSGR